MKRAKHQTHFRAIIFAGLILTVVAVLPVGPDRAAAAGLAESASDAGSHVADTVAMEREVDAFEHSFTNRIAAAGKLKTQQSSSAASEVFWMVIGGALLGAVVCLRYIPGILATRRDASAEAQLAGHAAAAAPVSPDMLAEEQAFSDFAANFSLGRSAAPCEVTCASEVQPGSIWSLPPAESSGVEPGGTLENGLLTPPLAGKEDDSATLSGEFAAPESDPLKGFFANAPRSLAAFQRLIQELSRAAEEPVKQKPLAELAREVGAFKSAVRLPGLVPVWQMAAALEALLQQLIAKPGQITPSTLHTVAEAVDVIQALSRPGIRADLTEDPPIRVLAVDDDPISRHAVSFALKKTLNVPDLANNGKGGLELALENAYDAIFLDVQMPGMDGFDLCSKIRETELNRATPVVFITVQNDFNARAKSSLVGGHDLIGKPFLTFEVALKALTQVIRYRLATARPEQALLAETEPVAV